MYYMIALGRPHQQFTQPVSFSSPPNSKPPIPHLNARYLMLYWSHWHLLEIRHSGGFCGACCVICIHFGREKVHLWGCPDLPLLQDISIINVVQQCCNVEFGAGILEMPASGRHLHKGHRGRRQKDLSLLTYCEFQPGFCSQRCCQFIRVKLNLNGVNRWPA